MPTLRRLVPLFSVFALLLAGAGSSSVLAYRQDAPPAPAAGNVRQVRGLTVELRPPVAPLVAGREQEITVRLAAGSDPAEPVMRARLSASAVLVGDDKVTAGEIPVRASGVAGDYVLAATFPRAGEYGLTLKIGSGQEVEPPSVEFTVTVGEAPASGEAKEAPSPYTLDIKMDPSRPLSGNPVLLTMVVKEREGDKPVREFDPGFPDRLRLLFIREDLGEFNLVEPTYDQNKNEFTHTFGFTNGGTWRLFAETAPRGAGMQILSREIKVDGARGLRRPLMAQVVPQVREGGYTLTMRPGRLVAGETAPMIFSLVDSRGAAPTDIQPWQGALAHLYLVDRDAKILIHTASDEFAVRGGRAGDMAFPVRFPKGGLYKGWMIFQRGTQTITMPFVFRVADRK